jgi:hypothetical protein
VETLTEAQLFAACTPDLTPGQMPGVRVRLACPETGGIKRVRLVMDPVSGRPAVEWCARFGTRPITCDQDCLQGDGERDEP